MVPYRGCCLVGNLSSFQRFMIDGVIKESIETATCARVEAFRIVTLTTQHCRDKNRLIDTRICLGSHVGQVFETHDGYLIIVRCKKARWMER
jgi:hypothetical protein